MTTETPRPRPLAGQVFYSSTRRISDDVLARIELARRDGFVLRERELILYGLVRRLFSEGKVDLAKPVQFFEETVENHRYNETLHTVSVMGTGVGEVQQRLPGEIPDRVVRAIEPPRFNR